MWWIFIYAEDDLFVCLCVEEDCEFFVFEDLDLVEEGLFEAALGYCRGKVLWKLGIFYLDFLPFLDRTGLSFRGHGLIVPIWWRFGLMYQGGPLWCRLLFLLKTTRLILIQEHLTYPYPLQYTLGHDTHLLPLKRIIQKENILLFTIKSINLIQFRSSDQSIVIYNLN